MLALFCFVKSIRKAYFVIRKPKISNIYSPLAYSPEISGFASYQVLVGSFVSPQDINSLSQIGGGRVPKRSRKTNGKVSIHWLCWVLGSFGNIEMHAPLRVPDRAWTTCFRLSRMNTICGVLQALGALTP